MASSIQLIKYLVHLICLSSHIALGKITIQMKNALIELKLQFDNEIRIILISEIWFDGSLFNHKLIHFGKNKFRTEKALDPFLVIPLYPITRFLRHISLIILFIILDAILSFYILLCDKNIAKNTFDLQRVF